LAEPGGDPSGALRRAAAPAQVFVGDVTAPVLDGEETHHLTRVLRLADGDPVVVADGAGRWGLSRLRFGPKAHPELVADGPVVEEAPPGVTITVGFAPVKGERSEWIVQKLTEVGVDRIVPLVTERSVVRWEGEREARWVGRLQRVSRQAAAQSRRLWLPEVAGMSTLRTLGAEVAATGGELALARLGGSPPSPASRAVAVGPEGGWSPDELAMDLPGLGLGPSVLRSETAAVVVGALIAALRAGTVAPTGPQSAHHAPEHSGGN
jgi:16S rRNA (uracil1498-N3)-methyltransferase